MSDRLTGWLLDSFADPDGGVIIWLLGEDGGRHRLRWPLQTSFYASGPFPLLRQLWRFVQAQPEPTTLCRTRRPDLFAGPLDLLQIRTDTAVQPRLFARIRRSFPQLTYYDADIPISVQLAARFALFPTLRCQLAVANDLVLAADPLDSRWAEGSAPPLRVMTLAPDVEPSYQEPTRLWLGVDGQTRPYSLKNSRLLLLGLQAALKRHDPDLILTQFGDSWIFPLLRRLAEEQQLPFNPGREPKRPFLHKQASSYFTYGQVLHRDEQTLLYGRYHIDVKNALLFNEYDVNGVLEQARVSGMPVQEMARRSPGAGITAMQMITALGRGVLVPYRKQQVEYGKSARTLLRSDRGGLVFQPLIGVHRDVIEIDFVSMYPSIICRFNISPETVGVVSEERVTVPEIGLPVDQRRQGLLPETLQPILNKRVEIKRQMAQLTKQDCRYRPLKSRATALKWLLVVAFGYAGYKRARFGRIEAHEAITAYSREALLRAKEVAESLGYRVLHLYVDGLWVQKAGVKTKTAVQPLLDEIEVATGLPIALKGFYRWITFLPSKLDTRVAVPNRYVGAFEDGTLKTRGIELRRHDTPPFVASLLQALLHLIQRHDGVTASIPMIRRLVARRLAQLQRGQVPLEALIVTQRLSRPVADYRVRSPAARAAAQLEAVGKPRYPGQRIRFVYVHGETGVWAWDHPDPLDARRVDTAVYETLALRAVETVLAPWGITLTEPNQPLLLDHIDS